MMTASVDTVTTELLARVHTLAPQIATARDQTERDRRVPLAIVNMLRVAGFFRLCIPPEVGGGRVPFQTFLRVVEELAALDGAVGWVAMIGGSNGFLAGYLPERGAEEIFGEPGVIAAAALTAKGRAVPVDGGYRVTGRWPFASGIRHCAWAAGGSLIEQVDGLRVGMGDTPTQATMFFPIAEVEVLDTWHSGGLRGSDSADFAVQDVFVPLHRVCSNGRSDAIDPVSRVPFGTWGTPSVAAVALGIAHTAIGAVASLAGKVPTRGSVPLREQALVQVRVGQVQATLEAARLLFYDAAQVVWKEVSATGAVSREGDLRMKLASAHAADVAVQVTDRMHRTGGASSVYSGSPLDRCLRDIHVASQHAGLGDQHYEAAGRAILTPNPVQTLV